MKTGVIRIPSAQLAYELYGDGAVGVVIEMGLGASIAEWRGLYAWKFAKAHPELVSRLVLLDPLSPEDYRVRMELTEEEFKKSGADKTEGLRPDLKLTRFHLGWLVKKAMAGAPPFYYDNGFSKGERREILSLLGTARTYQTALEEYTGGHDMQELAGLLDKTEQLPVPLPW